MAEGPAGLFTGASRRSQAEGQGSAEHSVTLAVGSHGRLFSWVTVQAEFRGWACPSVPADDVHGSHGQQVCRRHELYVSFQDLGWLVIADSPCFCATPQAGSI